MRLFRRQDGRYYAILTPTTDLLGDQVVITFRGSMYSKMGGVKSYLVEAGQGADIEQQLVKTRLRHGYIEVVS